MEKHENPNLKNLDQRWNVAEKYNITTEGIKSKTLLKAIQEVMHKEVDTDSGKVSVAAILAVSIVKGCINQRAKSLEIMTKLIPLIEETASPANDQQIIVRFGSPVEHVNKLNDGTDCPPFGLSAF